MLKFILGTPRRTVHAPIQLRYANIRIRDGALYSGTLNPTAKANPSTTPTVDPTGGASVGGNLQAGTYYLKYTDVATAGGETLPSPESLQFTVVAGDIPQVTLPSLPSGISSRNIYITPTNGVSNSETLYLTGVTTTTQNLQNPYVAGGVQPPILNTTGVYPAGTSVLLIAGLTTALSNGMQFTVGGDPTTYKILSHTETLGVTTSVTCTPALVQAGASGEAVTFGPHVLHVKVGEGTLDYTEKKEIVYVKDRGRLDTVREGEDVPVEVKLQFTWEFVTAVSGSGTPTIEDALKRRGEASSWVTSSTDPCEPFCVDLEVEYVPPCSSVQREVISFKTFRYEDLAHDIKNAMVSMSGKANVTQPDVLRAA